MPSTRTPPTRASTRAQRATGDLTRRRMLDAARVIFSRDGFAGASVQAILDEVGVAPPALYHHFGNKRGLFVAVADEVYAQFVQALMLATQGTEGFEASIDAMIDAAGRLHHQDPTLASISLQIQIEARRNDDLRHQLKPVFDVFRHFAEEQARAAPPALLQQVGVRPLTLAIIAILNGLSSVAASLRSDAEFSQTAEALRLLLARSAT
ncbi:MAG: TetR/AcrR family transcriptional regulator [Burkholderiales bacterium]